MDIGKLGCSALEEEEGAFIPSDSFEFEGLLFPTTLADREAVGGKVVSEESFSKLSSESLILLLQLKLEQEKAGEVAVKFVNWAPEIVIWSPAAKLLVTSTTIVLSPSS